ncbi:MAG TPA: M56 family metallopeptidase [Puia sp.]|jgi:bla regulator protein BlaR1|nr:M56 family metallopeptidase [Puia sp.]
MNFIFFKELFGSRTVNALCWTLFHSLWQGLIFAFIAGMVIMLTRKAKPAFRYNILSGLLALMAITIVITFIVEKEKAGSASVQQLPAAYRIFKTNTDQLNKSILVSTEANSSAIQILNNFLSQYAYLIVAIWFFVLSAKTIRLIFTLIYTHRLKNYRSHIPHSYWRTRLTELCRQLRISKTVTLIESEIIKLPVVFGHLKPVIFIPLGLLSQLSPQQVEAVLVHELAHIHRSDYLVNMMQNIIESLFFFNPAMLWISSLIREERENCCDDMAIAQVRNKKNYLEALISFRELSLYNNSKNAVAFPGSKNSFLNRVQRIVLNKNFTLSQLEKGSLFICCIIALLFAFAFVHPANVDLKIKFSATHEQTKLSRQTSATGANGILTPNKKFDTHFSVVQQKKHENNPALRAENLIRTTDTLPVPPVSLKNLNYNDALETMHQVIADLVAEKVVRDAASVRSFALDKNTLTVNDEQQPEALHEKFRLKYNIQDLGLYYGPEKVQGRGIFIDENLQHFMDENYRHEPVRFKGDEEMLRGDAIKLHKYTEMLRADSTRFKKDTESYRLENSLLEQLMIDRRRLGIPPPARVYIQLPAIISNLIDELVANGIAKDKKDPISFNLTNCKLIVNGEAQPENIHEIFKQKFLSPKQYGLEGAPVVQDPDFGLHFDSKTRNLGLGISHNKNDP